MKFFRILSTIVVFTAAIITAIWIKDTFFDSSKTKVESLAPTLEKIQDLSELVTNRVYVSDVLHASNKDYEASWVINGDALITIDLKQAKLDLINHETQTATITLPLPIVSSPRVDHTRTKPAYIKGVRFALLRNPKNKETMKQDMLAVAQKSIEQAASRQEIIENAKSQAALIISNLYLKVNWKLTIEWAETEPVDPL